ncbi:MAG: rhomboid family intramembrane serine protease [Bacteroidota bacterium]
MLKSMWDDLKREFSTGNMVTRLIIINVSFFVLINLIKILLRGFSGFGELQYYSDVLHFFCISSSMWHNLTHPWALLTNMFLHEGFWHILWNMLFLYWFGRIVGDFIGNHRILPLYLLGGLVGGLVFILTANVLSYGIAGDRFALGASGAVMAIVVASATISPDYIMRLLFIGDVRLKYIVAVLLFLDMIGIANDANTGGHFAHLGGAFFGWVFVRQLQEGNDWSAPVNRLFDKINSFFERLRSGSRKARRPRVVYRNKDKAKRGGAYAVSDTEVDLSHQEQLDAILDKIKKNGYESLSSEEKEFLFNASKN